MTNITCCKCERELSQKEVLDTLFSAPFCTACSFDHFFSTLRFVDINDTIQVMDRNDNILACLAAKENVLEGKLTTVGEGLSTIQKKFLQTEVDIFASENLLTINTNW